MTPLQRRKVEALKLARTRVQRRDFRYICFALASVASVHAEMGQACNELKTYINMALGGRGNILETWQRRKGIEDRNTQNTRLDWIDWMIRCLEGTEP